MQAAAHIPSEMRDAPRSTKDGIFDSAGGRWFARDQTKHAKAVQLIEQHVGPQERVMFVVYGKVLVKQDWFDQQGGGVI